MASLEFSDITYTVETLKGKKKILNEINGSFPAGKLIAIMGPSGAGKSSLLNILTGFVTCNVSGEISLDGYTRNLKKFKKVSCYITQDDNLCDYLTAEENMFYAADFKLGNISKEEKSKKIYDVLCCLGLEENRFTMTSKLSGGQKKRLSVALELLSDPTYLFLDEPTTGLDIQSCYQCVNELKKLCTQGRTVICTIHQPSDSIFRLFDNVYVLSAGICIYQGDVEQLVPFLDRIGLPCSIYTNPADYVIELASGDYGIDKIELMSEAIANGANFKYTSSNQECKVQEHKNEKTNLSSGYEFCKLCKWQLYKLWKHKGSTYLRICGVIMTMALIGLIYINCGNDATKMLQNYYLLLSFIMCNTQPILMITILYFPKEKSVLKKELFNGYYRLKYYLVACTLTEIPVAVIIATATSIILYVMTSQLLELKRFAMFCLGSLMVTLIAESLGLFIGSCLQLVNGIFIGSCILTPLMLLSGFGFMLKDLSQLVRYVSNFAYFKYCLSSLSVALFGMNRPKWQCPEEDYCLYSRGADFISEIGVDLHNYWYDIMCLCIQYFGLRIATYFVMKYKLTKG